MPEGVADTTTKFFFFSGEDRDNSRRQHKRKLFIPVLTLPALLERLLHQIESCRAAADDANIFFVPTKIAHHVWQKRVKTTLKKKHPHRADRTTRFLYCLCHLNFDVMERFVPCLATTCCMVSTFLLVSSRRNAMSCLAMSCVVKSQHGRCSQGAATVLMT